VSISAILVRRSSEDSNRPEFPGLRRPLNTTGEHFMSNSRIKNVNRLLWTAQIVAALIFLFAGSMKFIMPAEKMQQGPIVFSMAFMHFIGTCECLGAFGLILPGLFRIRTWLTPLAAAGLTLIMSGATAVTVPAMGVAPALIPAIIGLVTAAIVYGRRVVAPIAELQARTLTTIARGTEQCAT
jgi:hypothetical protein